MIESTMLMWGLALLALALLFVIIDLFVPTMGILAVTALLTAIAGVVCLFRYDTTWGVIGSLLVLFGGPALAFLGLQMFPHTPLGRRLILRDPASEDAEGGHASADGSGGTTASKNELFALVGREGVVLTDLRPVGSVEIGGKRFDALAETSMIKAGTPVRVTSIADGLQIRVRATE